jgi:hypothetical protein
MAKKVLVVLLFLVVSAAGAFADDGSPSESLPSFVTFNLGVAIGPQLGNSSDLTAGTNFGFDFAVIDKLKVGYDGLKTALAGATAYHGLKMSYVLASVNGLDVAADIGFGALSTRASAIAFGVSTNVLKSKGATGISSALNLRVNYLSTTASFGDNAALLFIIGYSFGI